jgi:hypothetical protein
MYKGISIILIISIVSCCVHANGKNYNDIMRKQIETLSFDSVNELREQKVIIIGDPLFVDVVAIDGLEVSNVIISDELVPDPEKRYIIAHLIRNILINGAIIYDYDEHGNDFTMDPVVEVSENFIYENKQVICDVIYYLIHVKYFDLAGNPGSSWGKFFDTPLLSNIYDEVRHLETRLIEEDALISSVYYYYY